MCEEPDFTLVQSLGLQNAAMKVVADSTSIDCHTILIKLSLPFFLQQLHRHDNVRLELISRNDVTRDVILFYGAMILARAGTRRERAKPTCVVFTSKACRSTRVAAASWPTITELTPTVALRRLLTCHEQRTVFKRDDDRSVPPLREFFTTSRGHSENRT